MTSTITVLQQIEHEHLAAQLGMSGLAVGTTRHQWINVRQERLGHLQQELHQLVGREAITMMATTIEALPERLTRAQTERVVQREFGSTEQTEQMLTLLRSLWTQLDQLATHVGSEAAHTMVGALVTAADQIPS